MTALAGVMAAMGAWSLAAAPALGQTPPGQGPGTPGEGAGQYVTPSEAASPVTPPPSATTVHGAGSIVPTPGGVVPMVSGVPAGTQPVSPIAPGVSHAEVLTGSVPGSIPGSVPGSMAAPPPPPVFPRELQPRAGGLTADGAALRAIRSSYAMRAAEANIAVADAARAEAGRAMIPSIGVTARYTRLSPVNAPNIGSSGPTPYVLVNQSGAVQGGLCVQADRTVNAGPIGCNGGAAGAPALNPPLSFSFPVILDQFDLRGTITVPFTDLPLRLARVYEAAGLTQQARRLDAEGTRLQTGADARVAFYEYLRAVGQLSAAQEGLDAAQRHQQDLQRFVVAGTVARVDLLRVEAQAAESERLVIAARNGVELTEAQLRQRLHLSESETIVLGETIEGPLEVPGNLADHIQQAWHDRPEVASLERQARAVDVTLAAQRAAYLPSITGVFNVDVLSPNTRVVPQSTDVSATWDASLQLSWSPTGAFVNNATVGRIVAQREALVANVMALREGAELEVRSAWSSAQGARAGVDAARRQLASAEESYRVRRERFQAGSAISSDLTDAELDLVRARLAVVNANMDLREALARLRRAVGQHESE